MSRMDPSSRSGWTLVEVLVAVGVIGILAAILVPSLRAVRLSVQKTEAVAAMRQVFSATQLYCADYGGALPYLGTPQEPWRLLRVNDATIPTGNDGVLNLRYHAWYWGSAVQTYLSGRPKLQDFNAFVDHGTRFGLPEEEAWRITACRFMMTQTAFAVPQFWTSVGPYGPELLDGGRITRVRHPARKGLLLDVHFALDIVREDAAAQQVRVAFADGSVRTEPWVNRNFTPITSPPYSLYEDFPVMQTENGLNGIDF